MSENWLSFLIGVGSSLVSTGVIAFIYLVFCRPNIKISPHIAVQSSGDQAVYCFKFINSSIFFQASDVVCEVTCASPQTESSGTTLTHEPVAFRKSTFQSIPRRRNVETGDFAIQIGTLSDIRALLEGNKSNYLVIKIRAKNLFSGLSKSFEKKFGLGNIRNGCHSHGSNLNVV